MNAPEFSRLVRIDTLGGQARAETIEADAGERAALAKRFGLREISRLGATASISRTGDRIDMTGRLDAAVVQSCVASGEPVPATIAEDFALRFMPAGEGESPDEVELDEGDLDTVAYEGGAVDLGEAVAQTLALALDPFPRAPDADQALREAGVVPEGEEEKGPFGALKGLRDKLAGS